MAKPIIYFEGRDFNVGQQTGYYPLLETAKKKTDLDVAEEICIERRLSLSPEELLYAVKATLETVPMLMQMDGINREFTGLLRWFRSAKGRLDGPGGVWNDTCKAYVRAQLLKNTKADIDATFTNKLSLPIPRLDNVTWVGSQAAINCIKPGYPFCAYGRNMQFISGDTAKIVHGTTEHTLTCIESSVSYAKFTFPAGLQVEPGTEVTFVMSSRGGIAEAGATISTKNVVVIGGETVLAQTSDGVGKIRTIKDDYSTGSLLLGADWNGECSGLFHDAEASQVLVPSWYNEQSGDLHLNGETYPLSFMFGYGSGGTYMVQTDTVEGVPEGTYTGATLTTTVIRNTDQKEETITINLPPVVKS